MYDKINNSKILYKNLLLHTPEVETRKNSNKTNKYQETPRCTYNRDEKIKIFLKVTLNLFLT